MNAREASPLSESRLPALHDLQLLSADEAARPAAAKNTFERTGVGGVVELESQWTARKRERLGKVSTFPKGPSSRTNRGKGGATASVMPSTIRTPGRARRANPQGLKPGSIIGLAFAALKRRSSTVLHGFSLRTTSLHVRSKALFRPAGARFFATLSHGLRRGLHSYAASRLSTWGLRPSQRVAFAPPRCRNFNSRAHNRASTEKTRLIAALKALRHSKPNSFLFAKWPCRDGMAVVVAI